MFRRLKRRPTHSPTFMLHVDTPVSLILEIDTAKYRAAAERPRNTFDKSY